MKNEIKMTYPRTKYSTLNQEIKKYVNPILDEFVEYGEVPIQLDFTYTLDMYYEKYSYEDILSYLFYTSIYLGGAHPNNTIHTINYDIKQEKVVTIEDLIAKNPNILLTLSNESRMVLEKHPQFQNQNDIDMMIEGTKAEKENFQNFIFTKEGMLVLFEQYQIAPYSEGSFRIFIPYQKLMLSGEN